MKLLCVGDIHLGRQPSRIPPAVDDAVGIAALGPAAAWRRSVDYALEQPVDAVLLAGDVVEQEDDFFEAYRDLREGVQRLTTAGIRVLGVAGNHDVQVLPRLAKALPAFELLGAGGQWETRELQGREGGRARIAGWSFPQARVSESPLEAGFPKPVDCPTLGLLHCDRDQARSPHAPVRSSALEAAPAEAWLLGHIHRPDALAAPRPMGYLGSLTGMDPGEPGRHGPWQLELAANGTLAIQQVPLAPLYWDTLEIPVDGLDVAADIHHRVTEALERLHTEIEQWPQRPRAVGCRLRFTGRSDQRAALERVLNADDPRATVQTLGDRLYFVHDWRLEAQPAVDLEALAAGSDPAALLARKLLLLQGADSEARRALLDAAREPLAEITRAPHYRALGREAPDDTALAATLEAAALHALDRLLLQREGDQ
ncbi:metallophosphoesterase [Thioalkalivibrio sp. ALE31]|uniref:metallophosphoesterase family protein n=1 Tax=Thioalkalivibrio sp. ALE31 TaxID=1158182 RepID=UPI00036A39D8|nr:metallophosphoesterase [Thioalkalivibrio sp. ALE31]